MKDGWDVLRLKDGDIESKGKECLSVIFEAISKKELLLAKKWLENKGI